MGDTVYISMPSPAQTTFSPIRKVAEEILWLIFMINTEQSTTAPLPLDTTRRSSQVCRRWRSVLLGTSSIWGRLMDWRSLNQEADEWRNEVLRRSGTSLLWIKHPDVPSGKRPRGCGWKLSRLPKPANEYTLLFFQTLIMENWERIENFSSFLVQGKLDMDIQAVVQRKAPNLQTFTLPLLGIGNTESYQGSMFSNHAPRLRSFCSMKTHCNLNIAWMSNIRNLSLGGKFNNQEICIVLAHMPCLESLTLRPHQVIHDYCSPPIHLPILHTLVLQKCMIYVRDIIIPAPTTLILSGTETYGQESYRKYIVSMLHNHLSVILPKSIHLRYDFYTFRISNEPHPPHDPLGDYFDVSISRSSSSDDLEGLVDTLASPYFSTVTTLNIQCDDLKNRPQPCHHAFKRFLAHYSSVETLGIHERDIYILLQHVMTNSESEPLLFPMLRILVVIGFDFSRVYGGEYNHGPASGSIERFLKLRKNLGISIQVMTVDLTTPIHSFKPPSARSLDPALDDFVGMKVIWKWDYRIVEYECGSGHPEQLQFNELS